MDIKEKIEKEIKTEQTEVEQPKKKRGRPKGYKVKKDDKEKQETFKKTVQSFGTTILKLVENRLPNPKPFSKDEIDMFNNSFGNVVSKYASSFGNYEEEISFAVVSIALFYPRLKKPEKEKSEKKDAK